MDSNIIEIDWGMTEPYTDGDSIFVWDGNLNLKSDELEPALGWARGTLSVLVKAFELGLRRGVKWDLSNVEDHDPYKEAARNFKRGTSIVDQKVQTSSSKYNIYLGSILETISQRNSEDIPFLVIDRKVAEAHHLSPRDSTLVLDLNERTKTLESVGHILSAYRKWVKPGCDWTIVGGGVLCDVAAYAASIAKCEFRLIPTTLLAMVDACIGGKTGVNFRSFGKNQLGRFAFPKRVDVDTAWLRTLPERQIRAGFAECIKHCFLTPNKKLLETTSQIAQTQNIDDLIFILPQLIGVKAGIVSKDPSEKSLRATLNLGHTFAHALEAISHESTQKDYLLHGEAVAIGLLGCLVLSKNCGVLKRSDYDFMKKLLFKSKICPSADKLRSLLNCSDLLDITPRILEKIMQDKKNVRTSNLSNWILLEEFGKPYKNSSYATPVERNLIERAWLEATDLLHKQYDS